MFRKKRSTSNTVDQQELIKLYRKALSSGVPLDKLEKKVEQLLERTEVAKKVEFQDDLTRADSLKTKLPKMFRVGAAMVPVAFIGFGLFLVGSALMPIFGYYVTTLPSIKASALETPIPREQVLDVTPLIIAQSSADDQSFGDQIEGSGPVIIDAELDYTNLANWFEGENLSGFSNQANEGEVSQYLIDIPKLDIKNAIVKVGGTNLNESIIQWAGTALPGKQGAPVLFGHSILRQFYNPKENNPRRYNSIFSTIMTLEKGDKIYVTVGNVKYTYMVTEKSEVKPTDTYILNQRYDLRQIKLVTCVPEGTYLRRGVITAQLVTN